MKFARLFLFSLLIFHLFTQPLWAYPVRINRQGVPSFDIAKVTEKEIPESLPIDSPTSSQPTRDEEFAERSEAARKFAFSDLPKHLGYDIKESFWGWGSLGLAVGIGAVAGLHAKDQEIQSSFAPHAMFGNTGDKVFDYMGAPYTMAGVSVLTTAIGAFIKNEKLLTTGEALLESLFWTELLTIGMQFAFNRTRPDGSKRGFPSAHTSGVFSTATVFQVMYGPKVGVPLYAFAALVALSRVDSYKHFPSDVLMGAALGTVIGYGTARFHKKLHNNFAVMPDIGPDRYGLMVSHPF